MDPPQGLVYLKFELDIALEEEKTVSFKILLENIILGS